MKKIRHILAAAVAAVSVAGIFSSCSPEYIKYEGKAYVMFPDTLFICPAFDDGRTYSFQVASLQKCDYDRTYAVEVLGNKGDAVYNWHYTLESSTVVIPAGCTTGDINVKPVYENLPEDSSPVLHLRLRSQYGDEMSEEGCLTKVELRKIKPFDISDYEGYCKLTSMFLIQYQGTMSRQFRTSVVPGKENTILLEDFICDGYDVEARFDLSDPLEPQLHIVDEQIAGDGREIFGMPHGDNLLRISDTPGYANPVSPWKRSATVYSLIRIEGAGIVGAFQNVLTWIEDYEAE